MKSALNSETLHAQIQRPDFQLRLWGELACFFLMIMNLVSLAAWYNGLIDTSANFPLQFLILGLILILSHYLSRAASASSAPPAVRQALALAWIVLAVLGSLRILFFNQTPLRLGELIAEIVLGFGRQPRGLQEFWHILITALLILRGVTLANRPINRSDVQKSFKIGLVSLFLYGLFLSSKHPIDSISALYAYLFISLIALSLARVADLGESNRGRLPRLGKRWAASVLAGAGGFILIIMLFGTLITQSAAKFIAQIVLGFFTALMGLILLVLSPLLAIILQAAFKLGELLFANSGDMVSQSAFQKSAEEALKDTQESVPLLTELVSKSFPIFLAVILAVLVLLILLSLRKQRAALHLAGEEISESITPVHDRPAQPFLQGLNNLRRRGQLRDRIAAARIRYAYAQLMNLCKQLGTPRPPALTPMEFLPHMQALFPDLHSELEQITTSYLRIRYGEYPETDQEVQAVLEAWERVRSAGRSIKTG